MEERAANGAGTRDEADRWRDDPELARRVVREGPGVLAGTGRIAGAVGQLSLLTSAEVRAFATMRDRIHAYREVAAPRRPLCLAVFGPPGSGKSFGVEELLQDVLGHKGETINLSQMEGTRQLAERMKTVRDSQAGEQVPAVFFDEFDSRLAGTPLGWLQWLLAPMQDGTFALDGEQVELKRAVYVFAGGTADTFEQFQAGASREFRVAKGPDFVSRLRGHLNILGVNNGPYRRVRRALVLRRALEKGTGLLADGRILPEAMDDAFIDQLLGVGRYRHGARSVEALVEMSTRPDQRSFAAAHLPAAAVRANHVDLGPLGETVIALSAASTMRRRDGSREHDAALHDVWQSVATRLLEHGAALVYGGRPRENGFLARLVAAHERLPRLLPPDEEKREPAADESALHLPPAATVTWVRGDGEAPRWDGLHELPMPTLSEAELEALGLTSDAGVGDWDHDAQPFAGSLEARKRLAHTVRVFRMRALITRLAHAHVAFGGRPAAFRGRFPGVVEEVMLSLAAGTPVYVCGGFGGGAFAAGEALGLGSPWAAVPPALSLETHGPWAHVLQTAVRERRELFQLPYRADLPVDYDGLVAFLRAHALGGPGWPDNGLGLTENRRLFTLRDAGEIFALVERGLRALRER